MFYIQNGGKKQMAEIRDEFVNLYFPVLFCLSVSVKWLAVKTASEMTYTVSSGALNSTPTPTIRNEITSLSPCV